MTRKNYVMVRIRRTGEDEWSYECRRKFRGGIFRGKAASLEEALRLTRDGLDNYLERKRK